MNRREMLKLGSLAVITSTVSEVVQGAVAEAAHAAVPQWEVFELSFAGPHSGNPFIEVQLGARLVLGRKVLRWMDSTMEWEPTRSNSCRIQWANGLIRPVAMSPTS